MKNDLSKGECAVGWLLGRPAGPARGFAARCAPLGTLSQSAGTRTREERMRGEDREGGLPRADWGGARTRGGRGAAVGKDAGRGRGAEDRQTGAGVARRMGGGAQRHSVPRRGRASAAPAPLSTARDARPEERLPSSSPAPSSSPPRSCSARPRHGPRGLVSRRSHPLARLPSAFSPSEGGGR